MSTAATIPEAKRNRMLRRVDWRLALNARAQPRLLDLGGDGRAGEALALTTRPAGEGPADLVLLGFPTDRTLRRARAALAPGGEVACLWAVPRPRGLQRAAARLRRAGFTRVRSFWPGPDPRTQTEFWLPLESSAAIEHVFSLRPTRSRSQDAIRTAWERARRAGAVGPVVMLAQLDGATASSDEIDDVLPPDRLALVLNTGGDEIGSKIAALPFLAGEAQPQPLIVKLGRGEKADRGLRREGELLIRLAAERGILDGVPRVHAQGTRAGGVAIVQDAFEGPTLSAGLDLDLYARAAPQTTRWLISLAGSSPPQPPQEWAGRLIDAPLDELERDFADLFPRELAGRARLALAGIGPLPLIWEHRDLGPWNVIRTDGGPAVIDWEDAEPEGLPLIDLVYFLTMAALIVRDQPSLPGDLGDTARRARAPAIAAEILDPATALGGVATACIEEYREAVGVADSELGRLRVLCWVVQSLKLCRHMRRRGDGAPLDPGENISVALLAAELDRIEAAS